MWWLIAVIAAVDFAWADVVGLHLAPIGILPPLLSTLVLLAAAHLLRRRGPDRPAVALVVATAQLIASFAVCGVLSYLAFTTNRPLVDRELAALDALCGFDWPRTVAWVQAHPALDRLLGVAYLAIIPELLIIVVLLGALRPERIRALIATSIIALLLVIAVSAVAPAADAYYYWRLSHPELIDEIPIGDHFALRAGVLHEIDLRRLQGLVTFPSYHVVLALLFIWAVRGIKWLLPLSLAFNAIVVVSTLSAGGHYMIDAPGGLVVTLIAIALHRAAARGLAAAPILAASLAQASKEPAMRKPLAALLADRSGTTAVEYGLLVALLTLAIVGSITTVYNDIGGLFNTIAADLQNSPAG